MEEDSIGGGAVWPALSVKRWESPTGKVRHYLEGSPAFLVSCYVWDSYPALETALLTASEIGGNKVSIWVEAGQLKTAIYMPVRSDVAEWLLAEVERLTALEEDGEE